jgi:hypothetical protein
MSESVQATSGGIDFPIQLDFETHRWTATSVPPEGEFPFVVLLRDQRFEIYSDGTFAEVER